MIDLLTNSYCVLTDSGGVQEESTALKIPCLTLRDSTERPITVSEGTNQIVGVDQNNIEAAFNAINTKDVSNKNPVFWDGQTSKRIVDHLKGELL